MKRRSQFADRVGLLCSCVGLLCSAMSALAQEPDARAAGAQLRALPFVAAEALRARKLRGFKAEVARQVFTAEEGGEIAVAVSSWPLPGAGADAYVPLVVEIDGASFLSHNQAAHLWLEVYTYAITPDGSVAGHFADAVAVDVAAMGEELVRGGLKVYGHLELPPGEYRLRVLVRNPQSGASGVRESRLAVLPESSAGPVAVFPESAPRWLAAVESDAGAAAIDADYPFVADGRALSPAARPVLAGGRESEVRLFGVDLSGRQSGKVRFLASGSGESTSLGEVGMVVDGPPLPAPRGLEALSVRFRPPELPAGEYRLRFELDETTATVAFPVWLTAGDVRERDLLWTDLRWMIDGATTVPLAADRAASAPLRDVASEARERLVGQASGGRQRRRVRRASESYLTALATLAGRPIAESGGVLFELESGVLGRGAEQLSELRTAEVRVADQLARKDSGNLVPLLAAHLELYRTYRGRRLHSLLAHSRLLTEVLAETYAGAGGSGTVAAHALACLGGDLQEADLTASSQRLFGRALEHDPRHLGALLGLATSFERHSRYPQAAGVLERLVEAHPDFAEGRLRLAINLDRLSLRRRSRELLTGLLAADPPWVAALAYQHLARRHLEAGALGEAERLLVESIRNVPGEPGSRLLLAYLYDRQKKPFESLELLRDVQPSAAAPARRGSAVRIYDSWPRAVLDQARQALAEEAELRRARLAAAVR